MWDYCFAGADGKILTCVNTSYVTMLFSFHSLEAPPKEPNPTVGGSTKAKKKNLPPGGNLKGQSQGVPTSHTYTAVCDHQAFV